MHHQVNHCHSQPDYPAYRQSGSRPAASHSYQPAVTAFRHQNNSQPARQQVQESSNSGNGNLSNTQLKRLRRQEWQMEQRANPLASGLVYQPPYGHAVWYQSRPAATARLTKQVGIDCEMVGAGPRGSRDMLARVSIVDYDCNVLYDKYVLPIEPVTDFRSFVSGIYPHHLSQGEPFVVVQREVCNLLTDRIIVGHAIQHDLRVLYLQHPPGDIRDTSKFFDASVYGSRATPSLRRLVEHYLNDNIQSRAHDSVEDARAAMRLYKLFQSDWELQATGRQHQRR